MPFARLPAALLLLGLVAPLPAAPPAHRAKGDRVIEARRILTTYCGACHGEQNPRGRLRVFDPRGMKGHREPLAFLGDPAKEGAQILDLIADGSMPPGLHPRPTPAELKVLQEWAADGGAEYPKKFDDATATAAVLADFQAVKEDDRQHTRYVSFTHLADDPAALAKKEQALRAALPAKDAGLTPIDPAGTVFRLDLRPFGWQHRDLFVFNDKSGAADNVFPLIPFDLILLEYPHAVPTDQWGAEGVAAVKAMNKHRTDEKPWDLFRPQPFLRGEWLAAALRDEAGNKPTPLADDLAALNGTVKDVREGAKKVGPKPRAFAGPPPAQGDRAPITSWATKDAGPSPFKLDVEKDPPGPAAEDGSTFKLYAKAGSDAHARVLAVFPPDGHVVSKPLQGGSDVVRADKRTPLLPNDDGVFSISCGPGDLYYVLFAFAKPTDAAGNKIEVLTVKSVHAENPIHRFFPSDPTVKAVRNVTHIRVK